MNQNLISVVLPTFKRFNKIGKAINSVINQTYNDWELIIIDNNSNDGTAELVDSYKNNKITFLTVDNNGSVAKSRNLGIKNSRGSIIAFLDSDDYWNKKKIEKSVELIKNGYDFIFHDMYLLKSRYQFFQKKTGYTRDLGPNVFADLLNNGPAFPTSSVVVKKKIIESAGNFGEDQELITWEDYDTWIKIAKNTNRFVRLGETLGYLGIGKDNYLQANNRINNIFSFSKKYFSNSNFPQWCSLSLAKDYFREKHFILSYQQIAKINFASLKILDLLKIFYILLIIKLLFIFKK
jgi:glycosyltransferase involved in cell wall biosynthesis